MFGPKYVWIVPGDYSPNWWQHGSDEDAPECGPEELREVLEGHFGTDVLGLSTTGDTTIANMVGGHLGPIMHNGYYNKALSPIVWANTV